MVLPELLCGVLAGHALEDLGAARVVVEEACGLRRLADAHVSVPFAVWGMTMQCEGVSQVRRLTGNVVDAIIDDDVHARLVLVLGDFGLGELLGHGGGGELEEGVRPGEV